MRVARSVVRFAAARCSEPIGIARSAEGAPNNEYRAPDRVALIAGRGAQSQVCVTIRLLSAEGTKDDVRRGDASADDVV